MSMMLVVVIVVCCIVFVLLDIDCIVMYCVLGNCNVFLVCVGELLLVLYFCVCWVVGDSLCELGCSICMCDVWGYCGWVLWCGCDVVGLGWFFVGFWLFLLCFCVVCWVCLWLFVGWWLVCCCWFGCVWVVVSGWVVCWLNGVDCIVCCVRFVLLLFGRCWVVVDRFVVIVWIWCVLCNLVCDMLFCWFVFWFGLMWWCCWLVCLVWLCFCGWLLLFWLLCCFLLGVGLILLLLLESVDDVLVCWFGWVFWFWFWLVWDVVWWCGCCFLGG